eukprot:scaffold5491_cov132-Cylindrotheca_fusiformis.AAC.2
MPRNTDTWSLQMWSEGVYLHADMDNKTVIMIFKDEMVDYMVQTNLTKYKSAVHVMKNGKKVLLYVQLLKALYSVIQSALLWWKLLTSTALIKEGFVECSVCWYGVDDLKISHVDKKVVENIVTQIEKRYGKMTITRGSKHTYIGMDIEFPPGNREVQILMMDYIREAIEAFPEDCSRRQGGHSGNELTVQEVFNQIGRPQYNLGTVGSHAGHLTNGNELGGRVSSAGRTTGMCP